MTEKITFGEKCASMCAKVFASWKFGITSLIFLNMWAICNALHIVTFDKDLAFANFNLSQLTYFVDLVLMMNAVRQSNMDRQKLNAILKLEKVLIAENDVVKKELTVLHSKLNYIMSKI